MSNKILLNIDMYNLVCCFHVKFKQPVQPWYYMICIYKMAKQNFTVKKL